MIAENTAPTETPELPDWLAHTAPTAKVRKKPLSPSDLGGAKALPSESDGMDEDAAMRRGSLIHLLLEHLPNKPQAEWDRFSQNLLKQYDNKTGTDEAKELLNIAMRVLNADALKSIFASGTLAEVNITAKISELGGQHIYGTIDRLVISEKRIVAVDYKSNRVVPNAPSDVPVGLLRQMGAYLSALKLVYPNHEIDVAILWTQNQQLMFLPHDIAIDALKSATIT